MNSAHPVCPEVLLLSTFSGDFLLRHYTYEALRGVHAATPYEVNTDEGIRSFAVSTLETCHVHLDVTYCEQQAMHVRLNDFY